MAYRIKQGESLQQATERIATEQIEKALDELSDPDLSRPKVVHQIRKRCKKLRGLVRLVRPASEAVYQTENEWFRDTARMLSSARDAKVMQDTYDLLMDHFGDQVDRQSFAPIRGKLTRRRQELIEQELDTDDIFRQATERLQEAKERISDWCFCGQDASIAAAGACKTYGRARDAWKELDEDSPPEDYHELRKRTKYHMYHCRLLRPLWRLEMEAREEVADKLGDHLGDDHDLAVLRTTIDQMKGIEGKTRKTFIQLIDQRRRKLEKKSRESAARLFGAEKTKAFEKRIAAMYRLWLAND